MVVEDELLTPEADDRETLQSRLNGVRVLAFYVFPQLLSTATSVTDLSTTLLTPGGFIIAADVFTIIPNVTPFTHFWNSLM